MDAHQREQLTPGMEVYDATGQRVGSLTAVAVRLHPERGSFDPTAPCPDEVMLDVHTSGFLGFGERLDVPITVVERIEGHTIFLARPIRELRHHR